MTNILEKEVKSNRTWREECEALRQRVKDTNHGAERNAIINRELAQELAALK